MNDDLINSFHKSNRLMKFLALIVLNLCNKGFILKDENMTKTCTRFLSNLILEKKQLPSEVGSLMTADSHEHIRKLATIWLINELKDSSSQSLVIMLSKQLVADFINNKGDMSNIVKLTRVNLNSEKESINE